MQAKSSITRKINVYFLLTRQACVLDNLFIDYMLQSLTTSAGPYGREH